MFKLPLVIVNFKTYREATGDRAYRLAKKIEIISKKFKGTIAIAPQFVDLRDLAKKTRLPIFAQHVDFIEYGPHTGHVLAESVKQAGCIGTLINHSERPLKMEDIKKTIQICRRKKLITVVCVPTVEKARKVAWFHPNYIAYEVPELISTGRAISKEMPKSVKSFVDIVNRIDSKIIPLCGAGISSKKDIDTALKLGTMGVLISKAVVTRKNLEKIFMISYVE